MFIKQPKNMETTRILFFLILPFLFLSLNNEIGRGCLAKEDELEDDNVVVEDEVVFQEQPSASKDEESSKSSEDTGGSVNADITLLFTNPTFPSTSNLELPAGKLIELLIGFTNKGNIDFIIETLDASLRYPMDFNFRIQNFTTIKYEKKIPSGYQASLGYGFIPADSFAGRPFGLSINLAYKDETGLQFYQQVYNETITVVEIEEGLDGETFFLYLFLLALVILLLVTGKHFLSAFGKKRIGGGTSKKPISQIETGTKKANNVDLEWLPKNMLNEINKSPRVKHNQQSPRHRKNK